MDDCNNGDIIDDDDDEDDDINADAADDERVDSGFDATTDGVAREPFVIGTDDAGRADALDDGAFLAGVDTTGVADCGRDASGVGVARAWMRACERVNRLESLLVS